MASRTYLIAALSAAASVAMARDDACVVRKAKRRINVLSLVLYG